MAYYTDPIHGRLKILIKTIGGYDFNFHVSKVAKDENIDREIVLEIFRMTSNKEAREYYLKTFKQGYDLDFIRALEQERSKKSLAGFKRLLSVYSMLGGSNNYYMNMFK